VLVADLGKAPLEPKLSPPTNVTVNGKDAAQALSAIGDHPSIAWGAPVLGTATFYHVSLKKLSAEGSGLTSASFIPTDTKLGPPKGTLEAGSTYFAVVEAASSGSIDAPKRIHQVDAVGQAVTGLLTP